MINMRFYDIQKSKKHTEAKNGDEIVADIVSSAGLELA